MSAEDEYRCEQCGKHICICSNHPGACSGCGQDSDTLHNADCPFRPHTCEGRGICKVCGVTLFNVVKAEKKPVQPKTIPLDWSQLVGDKIRDRLYVRGKEWEAYALTLLNDLKNSEVQADYEADMVRYYVDRLKAVEAERDAILYNDHD